MAKIFSPPKNLPVPQFDMNAPHDQWMKDDAEWTEKLRQFCLANGDSSPEVGEVISFPWADGHASYMVLSMKPVKLVHMPLGDAWQYPDADLQTAKRIREHVRRSKGLAALFAKKAAA